MIVVLPMAGAGKRFAGATFPKPLLTIRNKPMIQWVVENLAMPWAHHVFVCRPEDLDNYALVEMCAQLVPTASVVRLSEPTEGAAETVLVGLHGRAPEEPLLIANCDQWLQWDAARWWRCALGPGIDGALPVFRSAHPKWSYAQVVAGQVTEVAEKRPISPWATCGLYYWHSVDAYRDCALRMMQDEGKRVHGEWYVAPVYNELIQQGGHVMAYPDVTMWGLGTPEDLEEFKMACACGRISP